MTRYQSCRPDNVYVNVAHLLLVIALPCLLLLEDVAAIPYRVNEKPNGVAQVFIPGSPPCRPAPTSHLHQRLPALSISSSTDMMPSDSRHNLSTLAALPDGANPSVKHTERRRRRKKHKRKRTKRTTTPEPVTESSTPQDPPASSDATSIPSRFWETQLKDRRSKNSPSWQCQLLEFYKEMPPDYFPRYVRTGACLSTKCLHGMYTCVPHYYPVLVMRRSKQSCVPLPLEGPDAVYEEAWEYVPHQVVVGCTCRPVGRPPVLPSEEDSEDIDLYSRLTSWKITTS